MKKIILRKKQILILTSAIVVFIFGVVTMQFLINVFEPLPEIPVVNVDIPSEPEVAPTEEVEIEVLQSPVSEECKIVRYFYDVNQEDQKLEQALILFENVYRPNMGIDYSFDGTVFDVYASTSGEVVKKSQDPLLGWIVTISTSEGIKTTYQALGEVTVEQGATVKQGDKIGSSGENIYEADLKNHLHFIVEKDDQVINPETAIGKKLNEIN